MNGAAIVNCLRLIMKGNDPDEDNSTRPGIHASRQRTRGSSGSGSRNRVPAGCDEQTVREQMEIREPKIVCESNYGLRSRVGRPTDHTALSGTLPKSTGFAGGSGAFIRR